MPRYAIQAEPLSPAAAPNAPLKSSLVNSPRLNQPLHEPEVRLFSQTV